MKPRDIASYIFLAAAWGLSFAAVLKAVHAFGWVGAVAFRALIAGVTLFLIASFRRGRIGLSGDWRHMAVIGGTTVTGQLLGLAFATPRIGTALTAILVASIPLFSMVLGRVAGIENISRQAMGGLVLGLIGIVMLVGFPAVPVTKEFLLGCAAALFACVCGAAGSLYASQTLKRGAVVEMTAGSFLIGGALALPLLLAVPVPGVPVLTDYLYLAALACVMSATTYVVYFQLVASIGPTKAISVEFAVTLVAVIVGALLLREPLSGLQLAGGATVLAGCAMVLGLFGRRKPQAA